MDPGRIFIFIFPILLIFTWSACEAQQPAFFTIGEKDLAHTDVYALLEAEDGLLYAATDDGLYAYKHGKFIRYQAPAAQRGNALFNLVMDNDGQVYCGNLSGQIFRITDGRLELYAEVPSEYVYGNFRFLFDNGNNLIYSSQTLLKYANDSFIPLVPGTNFSTGARIRKLRDGRLISGTFPDSTIIWIDDGKVTREKESGVKKNFPWNEIPAALLSLQGDLICIFPGGKIWPLKQDHLQLPEKKVPQGNLFQFSEEEIWILGTSAGANTLRREKDSVLIDPLQFGGTFLSTMTIGKDGVLYFGTFGKGVIVVPDRGAQIHAPFMDNEVFQGITSDGHDGAFLSTRSGKLFYISGQGLDLVEASSGGAITKVFIAPGMDLGLNDVYPELLYEGNEYKKGSQNVGSLKDMVMVDSSCLLVAGATGVARIGEGLEELPWEEGGLWPELKGFKQRSRSVAYLGHPTRIYIASHVGLVRIGVGNQQKEIRYGGKMINANDLLTYGRQLWCATQRSGILIFEDDQLVDKIDLENGLGSNNVKKILKKDNQLFVLHDKGIQILHLSDQTWTTLGAAEGIVGGAITDFSIGQEKLWLLADYKPVSIDLDKLTPKAPNLSLILDSLTVSGRKVLGQQGNLIPGLTSFPYNQNHFSFYFDFREILYMQEAGIRYRLEGLEEKWTSVAASEEMIEYKSLPSGEFVFEMQAFYRDKRGPMFRMAFTIHSPFWQTWWFLTSIGLLIILSVLLIYTAISRRQLRKERHRNELNTSKLTAIQSQMNPHFIFNSLNSIQDLVLQGDEEKSYTFITKFANLIRKTLKYSGLEFIDLEQEVQLIELYLTLEKQRFKSDLEFEIIRDEWEGVQVPPMLVQPFIENALVHGLLHKEGIGKISIEFELGEVLICTITDNGIGRKRAREIRQRQRADHESFSVQAIRKRFEILRQHYQEDIGFDYEDLEEKGVATGTKVRLKIPVRRML